MTTATKSTTQRPNVTLSDATKESLKVAKMERARELVRKWLEEASLSALESVLKDAGLNDQGKFLTSDILDCFTKSELAELAAALGIELTASWPKRKAIVALLESPELALPKAVDAIRPRT